MLMQVIKPFEIRILLTNWESAEFSARETSHFEQSRFHCNWQC